MSAVLLLLKGSCAAEPEYAGVCKLDCGSGTKVASNDMRIRFLTGGDGSGPGSLALKCFETAGADYPQQIPLRFVVEKPRRVLPAENTVESGTIGGAVPAATDSSLWVPVSGIGFEPILVAGQAEARAGGNENVDRYRGVMTEELEWCTDSCGVGSIEVRPSCKNADTNTVVYSILSGSLEEAVTITVTQP